MSNVTLEQPVSDDVAVEANRIAPIAPINPSPINPGPIAPINPIPPIGPAAAEVPSVEIFANQLPILIRQGQTKTITLTGAVYDKRFQGSITLKPSPNFATGCPLFGNVPFNGVYNNLSLPVGANSVSLALSVTGPTTGPLGARVCTLRYDAIFVGPLGQQTSVGKGNTISVPYTLKKQLLPGEADI